MSAHWNYSDHGPCKWHENFPIANGPRQSPIDVVPEECQQKDCGVLKADYNLSECTKNILNDGHSIKVEWTGNSNCHLRSSNPDFILGANNFRLLQFHFHWSEGAGSEHTINGKQYAAELHFVHANESHENPLEQGDGLAVLGIFLDAGDNDDASFEVLVQAAENHLRNAGDKMEMDKDYDPSCFLADKDLSKFYHYEGSLTTPPLLECVQWFLLDDVLSVSKSQIARLSAAMSDSEGNKMVDNWRPAQPVKGRNVYKTFSGSQAKE